MSDNIFAKGTLVKLDTSCWTGRAKIPSHVLLDGSQHADVDPGRVGAHKRLVDGKALNAVEKIRGEARTWLYDRSLPFPLDGVVFVPTPQIPAVDEALQGFADRYHAAADEFAEDFASLREAARASLGSLYDETDYPADVRDRFSFAWRFLTLAPPGESQLLDPAMVAREQEKFARLMTEATEQATTALRVRFAQSVDHMVDRLTGERDGGKTKIFRDSLVGNLREFIGSFKALNVNDDGALEALIDRAKCAIDGVDAKDLRSDDSLRAHVASQMATVQEALDGMMVDRPTRKLRFGVVDKGKEEAA